MKQKKREIKAKEHNLRIREISDSLKRNIRLIGVPEDEEKEKGVEGLCEQIIVENIPNLGKDTDSKIQEAQKTPSRFNKNRPSTRHIMVKFTKYSGKERIMKAARKKSPLPTREDRSGLQQTYPQKLGRQIGRAHV